MKRVLLPFLLMIFSIACDDGDDGQTSNEHVAEIRNTAANGQWRIVYFFDTDKEETDNFNGYIFEFDNGGTLTATNGSNNYPGSWSVTHDGSHSSGSHDSFDDIDFNIAFSSPPDFEELSEDWEIISISESKIELRHVSGGNGGTDLLTFEKI